MADSGADNSGNATRVDDAIAEYLLAADAASPFDRTAWLVRHADIRAELEKFLADEGHALGELGGVASGGQADPEETTEYSNSRLRGSGRAGQIREAPEAPQLIGGYRLTRLLGVGGMGRVFAGVDAAGHEVAIKLLSKRFASSDDSLRRFKQEGAIASAINHPRCVFVKTADEDRGQPYIVMELMTGRNLRDLVVESGRLPVRETIAHIMDVLDGLQEAHAHGMIHRDIKPANCYLEANGRVKLGDFGLARSIVSSSELTRAGNFVGTPLFASPEQIRGEKLDERTDIYSVCATLYFLLTGQAPFANSSATQVIARIVSEDPVPPRQLNPAIPAALERLVLQGLSRDRKQRFQTVEEMRQALLPFVTGKQVVARLGKRLAAYGIDFFIFSLYALLIGLFHGTGTLDSDGPRIPDLLTYATLILPLWIYNLVMEGRWQGTAGKLVMRLRVADAHDGGKAGWGKIFLRATFYTLLSGVGSDLIMFGLLSTRDITVWSLWQSIGYGLSYLLISLPLLFTGGRSMLHDLLSRTSLVDLPDRSPLHSFRQINGWQVAARPAPQWPESFGGHAVRGVLYEQDAEAVLLADDKALGRQVWLYVRPRGQHPLSLARQTCDRTSRLRWLTGGSEGQLAWDAFLAFQGAPLTRCFTRESTADWSTTGRAMLQILEELERSRADQTLPLLGSQDQVWMDGRGRICILDWPLGESALDSAAALEKGGFAPALYLETARAMLTGSTPPSGAVRRRVSAIVPLSARLLLDRLAGSGPPFVSEGDFAAALGRAVQSPSEVTFLQRLATVGLSVVTLGLLFFMLLSLCRIGNQVAQSRLTDNLIINRALAAVAADTGHLSRLFVEQPALKQTWNAETLGELSRDREAQLLERFHVYFNSLSKFHRKIGAVNGVDGNPEAGLQQIRSRVTSADPLEITLDDWRSDLVAINLPLNSARLKDWIDRANRGDLTGFGNRAPLHMFLAALALPFLAMVWAGLARGGVPMLAIGLRLVRRDGRPAPLWLYCLRSLLVWLPVMALLTWLIWLDFYHPEQLFFITLATQLLLVLPVAYAVMALISPRRGPHDWLLGTSLVPR